MAVRPRQRRHGDELALALPRAAVQELETGDGVIVRLVVDDAPRRTAVNGRERDRLGRPLGSPPALVGHRASLDRRTDRSDCDQLLAPAVTVADRLLRLRRLRNERKA